VSTFLRITNGVANTSPGDFGRELERGCTGGVEERKKEKKEKKWRPPSTAEGLRGAQAEVVGTSCWWGLRPGMARGGVWGGTLAQSCT
jgi:hypothetical protein